MHFNIVLRANPDGSVLRIKDVARVEIGAQNMDSESRIDGGRYNDGNTERS
jgi:multidrug efflux pump subunit AcrB